MIEEQFRDHLIASHIERVSYNRALDYTLPYVVLTVISKTNEGLGLTRARIQCDCYGHSWGQAKIIAREVTDAIITMPINAAFASYRLNEIEGYEDDPGFFRVIVEADLHFVERETF